MSCNWRGKSGGRLVPPNSDLHDRVEGQVVRPPRRPGRSGPSKMVFMRSDPYQPPQAFRFTAQAQSYLPFRLYDAAGNGNSSRSRDRLHARASGSGTYTLHLNISVERQPLAPFVGVAQSEGKKYLLAVVPDRCEMAVSKPSSGWRKGPVTVSMTKRRQRRCIQVPGRRPQIKSSFSTYLTTTHLHAFSHDGKRSLPPACDQLVPLSFLLSSNERRLAIVILQSSTSANTCLLLTTDPARQDGTTTDRDQHSDPGISLSSDSAACASTPACGRTASKA